MAAAVPIIMDQSDIYLRYFGLQSDLAYVTVFYVSQDNLLKLSLKTHIMYMRYNNSVAQQ
jgi:hypothetical protein